MATIKISVGDDDGNNVPKSWDYEGPSGKWTAPNGRNEGRRVVGYSQAEDSHIRPSKKRKSTSLQTLAQNKIKKMGKKK